MLDYKIRIAQEKDAKAIHDIYDYYVKMTTATFSTENLSVDEYKQKIVNVKKIYPFYVAEYFDGKILGFVYGSRLRPHDAYRWNVESSLYLSYDAPKRCGIGTALYNKFIETLSLQGFKYVYGVITSENLASLEFHKKLNFCEVGRFSNMGNKFGKWYGIVWMQKQLNKISENPTEPIPFLDFIKEK